MKIRKNRCIKSNRTHCCIGKFNVALSLYKVLRVTLYFSKDFSETATRKSAVTKALQPLGVIIVCFLRWESNLWPSVLQQRHKLFSRHFLHLSLVNLPLLASLEERSTYREFSYFLRVGDRDGSEDVLVDEATRDGFVLFWETMA